MLETNNVGWNTYSDGVPGGMSLKQEVMCAECDRIKKVVKTMKEELEYFQNMTKDFLYFNHDLKEKTIEKYHEKIEDRTDEYNGIKENLQRQGIPMLEIDEQ